LDLYLGSRFGFVSWFFPVPVWLCRLVGNLAWLGIDSDRLIAVFTFGRI
jgi:hypothetical protein